MAPLWCISTVGTSSHQRSWHHKPDNSEGWRTTVRDGDRKTRMNQTTIPLVDADALPPNPSLGALVKDASTQVSTLVRAEIELAKAEIASDIKKGLTGSVFFVLALAVLVYSTFFASFFLAELLDIWLWRWVAFLIVFALMVFAAAFFALLGYLKVRRIRGPRQTIESVKQAREVFSPGDAGSSGVIGQEKRSSVTNSSTPADPSGW